MRLQLVGYTTSTNKLVDTKGDLVVTIIPSSLLKKESSKLSALARSSYKVDSTVVTLHLVDRGMLWHFINEHAMSQLVRTTATRTIRTYEYVLTHIKEKGEGTER